MGYALTSADVEERVEARLAAMRASRPPIVTLCGSTRFKDEIHAANARLTMEGNIVISLGVFGHTDMPERDWTTGGSEDKRMLDGLHREKIKLADLIYVVNVDGYVGESTRAEIQYAKSLGLPVRYLVEPEPCMDMWHFSRGEATGPCPMCGLVETWTTEDNS